MTVTNGSAGFDPASRGADPNISHAVVALATAMPSSIRPRATSGARMRSFAAVWWKPGVPPAPTGGAGGCAAGRIRRSGWG